MTTDVRNAVRGASFDDSGELGLEGVSLQFVREVGPPADLKAHGLAGVAPRLDVPIGLAERVDAAPDFSPLDLGLPPGVATVCRWATDPNVIAISEVRGTLRLTGPWEYAEREVVVDVSTAEAKARLTSDLGDFALQFSPDGRLSRVFQVLDANPRAFEHRPGSRREVEIPTLSELTAGLDTAPWLVEAFAARASSPHGLDRLSAVGLAGRLWLASPEQRPALLEAVIDGTAELPAHRVRLWADGQRELVDGWLPAALEDAQSVLEAFSEAPESLGDDRTSALADLVARRDDLESFAVLARAAKCAEALDATLRSLDEVAASHMSLLSAELSLVGDPHYEEVFAGEPDAWWGWLAE